MADDAFLPVDLAKAATFGDHDLGAVLFPVFSDKVVPALKLVVEGNQGSAIEGLALLSTAPWAKRKGAGEFIRGDDLNLPDLILGVGVPALLIDPLTMTRPISTGEETARGGLIFRSEGPRFVVGSGESAASYQRWTCEIDVKNWRFVRPSRIPAAGFAAEWIVSVSGGPDAWSMPVWALAPPSAA